MPTGSDEHTHFPENKKGLKTETVHYARILAAYYHLLSDDPERQARMMHDVFRSLSEDVGRLNEEKESARREADWRT